MFKIRNAFLVLSLILFVSIHLQANIQIEGSHSVKDYEFKKFEFGLFFGIGMPKFDFENSFTESETYHWYDSSYWYYYDYNLNLAYSSNVSGVAESKFGFGGFINYLFHQNIGLQFMLESSKFDVPVEASHSVDVTYSGTWGSQYFSGSPTIQKNTGRLSVMPISFNIFTKFYFGSNISGHASGGLTYYQVEFEAESKGGVGVWYYTYVSSYDLWRLDADSVLLPVSIDDSYSGTGGNIGGGFSFEIQKNIEILIDFRYYFAPKKEFIWETKAGNYDTVIFGDTLSISRSEIDSAIGEVERFITVEVDPSYYRFSLALKFMF